jgi:hypothetical protein
MGLREELNPDDLRAIYGSASDPRFLAERSAILKRIRELSPYGADQDD